MPTVLPENCSSIPNTHPGQLKPGYETPDPEDPMLPLTFMGTSTHVHMHIYT